MKKFCVLIIYIALASEIFAQENKTEYADILVESCYSKANKYFDTLYGGTAENFPVPIDAELILGDNTTHFVSLPSESYVIVRFTDNLIIDFPDQHDIFITESGCSGERADVFVSTDGVDFIKLGTVDDCRTSSLDLNKIHFTSAVRFVKIVGLDTRGNSPGFDLVNVKGLPNSSIETYIDFMSLDKYLKNQDEHNKKIILSNVIFESNSSALSQRSKNSLSGLNAKLKEYPNIKFKITGHTDNVGTEDFNRKLSLERARSVRDFLVLNGLNTNRFIVDGKGSVEPIKSNETEEGQSTNRRVELQIIE